YCKGTGDTALTSRTARNPEPNEAGRASSDATALRRTAAVLRPCGGRPPHPQQEADRPNRNVRRDGASADGSRAATQRRTTPAPPAGSRPTEPQRQTRRRFGGRQPCCDHAGDDPRTPSRKPTDRTATSDATALRRTAAVVRGRGDVLDGADLEARGLQGADRGLTTGARTLDEHVDLAHAVLLGAAGGRLGGHLRGERRGLPGALEADVA